MAMLCLLRTLILVLPLLSLPVWGSELTIVRQKSNQFPRCVEDFEGKNLHLKWNRGKVTRTIRYKISKTPCSIRLVGMIGWKPVDQSLKTRLPENLVFELEQIEKSANILREEKTAAEFIDSHSINTYTRELNRDLTPKYGPIFSAEVFKEILERKPGNKDFRNYVLSALRTSGIQDKPFAHLKDKLTLVVSFGLGWSDDYGIAAPYYIKDFLADIESLGVEVVYLKKNPFGMVKNNVRRIIPQLEDVLKKDKSVILLSLCKGTPELLSAVSQIQDPDLRKKIIGHVNLSGMLSGTFFADIAMSILLPKLLSPFLKLIPIASVRDAGKMASSASYMKSSVITETLNEVNGRLPEGVFTVNITGAPMSDRVMKNGSPMAAVLKYNYWQKFLVSSNDGFIELPHTLIPENLASKQVSLMLDSSHMLSDGYLEEFELKDRDTRRKLYQSIVSFILASQK